MKVPWQLSPEVGKEALYAIKTAWVFEGHSVFVIRPDVSKHDKDAQRVVNAVSHLCSTSSRSLHPLIR